MLVTLCASTCALANPRALPFTYPVQSLPEGALELEQFVDATPVQGFELTGELRTQPSWLLTTEFEYGLTDRLEAAFYFQISADPADGTGIVPPQFDGVKQRLRYRLLDDMESPVGLAVYGEIAELRDEIELEAKLLIQKSFGPLRLLANLWVEREFYYSGQREWVLHPTAGATYQLNPYVTLGAEYWLSYELQDGGTPAPVPFNLQPHHFIGPALSLQKGRVWWTTSVYARLDGMGRNAQFGDEFGRVYVRSVLGVEL